MKHRTGVERNVDVKCQSTVPIALIHATCWCAWCIGCAAKLNIRAKCECGAKMMELWVTAPNTNQQTGGNDNPHNLTHTEPRHPSHAAERTAEQEALRLGGKDSKTVQGTARELPWVQRIEGRLQHKEKRPRAL